MPKRNFSKSDEPLVEKLYRENLDSFTGAGGFCDDDDEVAERREEIAEKRQRRLDAHGSSVPPDDCTMCNRPILDSFLWDRFRYAVCDGCRDDKGAHKLISRTEAMKAYLLKDEDLDLRQPRLRYIERKNPHNPRYGDMKLYLTPQVIDRMLEVHGSFEELDEAKRSREEKREIRTERTFEKKVKEMRKTVRGLTATKVERTKVHEHSFGAETAVGDDEWQRECETCGYVEKFEKL